MIWIILTALVWIVVLIAAGFIFKLLCKILLPLIALFLIGAGLLLLATIF